MMVVIAKSTREFYHSIFALLKPLYDVQFFKHVNGSVYAGTISAMVLRQQRRQTYLMILLYRIIYRNPSTGNAATVSLQGLL